MAVAHRCVAVAWIPDHVDDPGVGELGEHPVRVVLGVERLVAPAPGAGSLGVMLIVAVLKRTGLFEFIAIWSAKRARGKPFRLMVLLTVSTAFLSAWLDNVTTILLIAPVTILVCTRLGLPVVPYLIAEAMASTCSTDLTPDRNSASMPVSV